MRHTLMLNLDEEHSRLLDDLRRRFRLSAEETARLTIRFAHAHYDQKSSALVPEFKPHASGGSKPKTDEYSPH